MDAIDFSHNLVIILTCAIERFVFNQKRVQRQQRLVHNGAYL